MRSRRRSMVEGQLRRELPLHHERGCAVPRTAQPCPGDTAALFISGGPPPRASSGRKAMSRIAGSSSEVAYRELRRRFVPLLSTLVAILLAQLPIVVSAPLLPDFGFLLLITWRLLRPEIWTARMALGLGLVADLVTGDPLGQ